MTTRLPAACRAVDELGLVPRKRRVRRRAAFAGGVVPDPAGSLPDDGDHDVGIGDRRRQRGDVEPAASKLPTAWCCHLGVDGADRFEHRERLGVEPSGTLLEDRLDPRQPGLEEVGEHVGCADDPGNLPGGDAGDRDGESRCPPPRCRRRSGCGARRRPDRRRRLSSPGVSGRMPSLASSVTAESATARACERPPSARWRRLSGGGRGDVSGSARGAP